MLPAACSLALVALILGGCPETEKGAAFKLVTIAGTASCPARTREIITGLAVGHTLRVTFLKRPGTKTGATYDFDPVGDGTLRTFARVCDRVISPKDKDVEILIPVASDDPGKTRNLYTVTVEAFLLGKLKYSGRKVNVDLSRPDNKIFLRPTGAFSCEDIMKTPRAFHTSTLLPNGHVLIIGGMVAKPGDTLLDISNELAYATGSIEVYEPFDSDKGFQFNRVVQKIPPRAFHAARLLPSPVGGPYRILLIGGVQSSAKNEASPAFRIKAQTAGYPFLISPHEKSVAASLAILEYTPGSRAIAYNEITGSSAFMFPAVVPAPSDDTIVVAGGASSYVPTGTTTKGFFDAAKPAVWLSIKDVGKIPTPATRATMSNVRVGHAAVRVGAGTGAILALGGNMSGNATDFIERHSSGGAFKLPTYTVAPAEATVWHTLTGIGKSDKDLLQATPSYPTAALWAGGYGLSEESNNLRLANKDPHSTPLKLVQDKAVPDITAVAASGGNHFAAAGYHDAIRLYDGSVLLSGGNATCGLSKVFCPSDQMVHYHLDTSQVKIKSVPPKLAVARMGHRTTRLLDNTVMITGGIILKDSQAQPTNTVEVINLRTGDQAEDYPLHRSAPQGDQQSTAACGLRYQESQEGS